MARAPTPSRFQAVRAKLNSLSYVQPLTEESLALVERLLEDLLKSAESFRLLEQTSGRHEQQMQDVTEELKRLHEEHPQLLKENIELHRRLLQESAQRAERRQRWQAQHSAATEELQQMRFLKRLQKSRSQEMQQSLETLQKRLEEMKKMAQGPHDGRARGMVMRGPPPRTTTQKRHIQVDMGGFFEGSSAFPRCAHLAEQLAVARRKCVSEANALETAEAKEEAAAEDLSRLQARAAERQLEPEDEDKVQLLKHEESALVLGKARLEEECSEMRQRLQLLEHNTEQEEQQVKQHLRQVSSAQQRLLVAKQAALRTPAREEESPELQAEVQELISQEAFLKQAEEEAQRQLQDDEAASQVQAEEHRSQCRRLEEELAAAEASRPTERVSRLQAALAEQTHEAAECRAQGSALAARLASLRTHTAMQRRSLETQQEAEALRRHNAQRASEEAFSAEARKGQLQLLLSGAKSEAEALQECLQSTSLERTALREEVAAARREEQELRQEEQVRRTAQLRLSRELEAARAGCWEAEAKKTEVQKKEAQLQQRAARGAHGLATEEANFAAVQTAHRQLSSGVGSTLQELGAVRDECQSEETNLMALKVRLRQLLPAQSAKAEAEAALQLRLGQLREELTQKQDLLRAATLRQSEAEAAAEEERLMGQAAEARVQHARRRLQAASASEQSACATQQELEARHGRLTARLAQLTAAVESLRRRFAAGAAELAEEQARSAEVLSGPSSVRRQLQEMTEEGQRLRETIAEMEADQRELQQAADVAGAELLQLSAESQRLRAQRGELQWTLDKLRQTLAHQHGELADDTRGTALTLEELRLAENEVQTYQSELAERVREEEEALQDLRHMTRENQLLHHELRLAQQRHQVLEDATQEHEAQKLPMMQELRGKEFQCEELRKACQEVAQQRLRNEAAVEELAQQVESSYMEIQELQGSLQGLEQNEETTRGSFHKSDSELAVLRTRMHEVTQCLEMQEFAQEQRKADQSRLRWVAGSQQTAINEAMMGAAAVAAQADSLRAEVASTQRKLDQARERLADETRRGQEAARSQAKLQALLAQQRQMHWQREAECSALRRPKLPSEGERQMLEQVEELERKMSREVKFLAEEAANLNTELAQSKATP